ncbi:MAG TPA: DUF4198 domain-containing protein [Bryobacteraceae bacterium]|nr:DUF4198 domain-containing protein [Bryobacteraceae bacterium]
MITHLSSTSVRRPLRAMALIVTTLSSPLLAHDLWIEPTTFAPEPGATVGVRLRVGQDLVGDPVPRQPALINQFVFEDAAGRKPLPGRNGADPAGFLRVATHGLLIIGYFSNPSAIELPADKFNQYLREEGLDAVAALRARRGQTGAAARETFSRCAKSLVLSGSPRRDHADRTLGFPLELVAERNPYAMRAGGELPVRLTWQRRPLVGALVVAINRLNPSEKQKARTGADGRVRIRLRQNGMWLVKAVHMVLAADTNADWASFWVSLTFELPATFAARNQQ